VGIRKLGARREPQPAAEPEAGAAQPAHHAG
jgi:hypothetical protein